MSLEAFLNRSIEDSKRRQLQRQIYESMLRHSENIRAGHFVKISPADLGLMFHLVDEQFFEGNLGRQCEQVASQPLSFRLSTRMTTTGGMTTMMRARGRRSKPQFEIAIATTPIFNTFQVDASAKVGGVACKDRLEALQRIMEHEMIHLAELLLTNDSNCSASPFRRYVRGLFGHTESNHRLLTPRDIARRTLGITTGDRVTFAADGGHLTGTVNRITKRATVLVRDPKGIRYSDGKRYTKYYVPLSMLKKQR